LLARPTSGDLWNRPACQLTWEAFATMVRYHFVNGFTTDIR
jgi:hypothetical protein